MGERMIDRLPTTDVTADFIDQCISYTAAVSRHGASLHGKDPIQIQMADESRSMSHNSLIAIYKAMLRNADNSVAAQTLSQEFPVDSRRSVARLAWAISSEMLSIGQS